VQYRTAGPAGGLRRAGAWADGVLRWGTPSFDALSDFSRRRRSRNVLWAVARADMATPLGRAMVALPLLPRVVIDLPPGSHDAVLGGRFRARRGGVGPTGLAVLDLPVDEVAYLAGGARQAIRTNVRRARTLGVTAAHHKDFDVWQRDTAVIAAERGMWTDRDNLLRSRPEERCGYFLARDATGEPIASAYVKTVGNLAVLESMVRRPSYDASSPARYLLHLEIVRFLLAGATRFLVVDSAFTEPTGRQYFQHLLGFRPRNLVVQESGAPAPVPAPVTRRALCT
jgi:hypothetical protein